MAYSYSTDESKWLRATITFALAALSASTAVSCNLKFLFLVVHLTALHLGSCNLSFFWFLTVYLLKRKSRDLDSKIGELQKSLKASSDICGAERQGRIRAQQVHSPAVILHLIELVYFIYICDWKFDWLLSGQCLNYLPMLL